MRYHTVRYQAGNEIKKVEIYAQSPAHAEAIFRQSNSAPIISCR